VVKPVEIDDGSLVNVTLWSKTADDHDLRRVAGQVVVALQGVPVIEQVRDVCRLGIRHDPSSGGRGAAAVKRKSGAGTGRIRARTPVSFRNRVRLRPRLS
jgi:hypothetical protein